MSNCSVNPFFGSLFIAHHHYLRINCFSIGLVLHSRSRSPELFTLYQIFCRLSSVLGNKTTRDLVQVRRWCWCWLMWYFFSISLHLLLTLDFINCNTISIVAYVTIAAGKAAPKQHAHNNQGNQKYVSLVHSIPILSSL